MDAPGGASALLLALLAGAALLLALVAARRGAGADFEIRVRRGGRVTVRGRLPAAKVGEIRAFFARDLGPAGPVAVLGTFGPGRSLRLRFSGRLSPGQRQRARNFLAAHLR